MFFPSAFVYLQGLRYLGGHCNEVDDRFDVVRLGEHVEGADGGEGVAGGEEGLEVAGEGGGVAGDVGDARGA